MTLLMSRILTTGLPSSVFLPGEFHGGLHTVHGVTESDMTERLTLSFYILTTGKSSKDTPLLSIREGKSISP